MVAGQLKWLLFQLIFQPHFNMNPTWKPLLTFDRCCALYNRLFILLSTRYVRVSSLYIFPCLQFLTLYKTYFHWYRWYNMSIVPWDQCWWKKAGTISYSSFCMRKRITFLRRVSLCSSYQLNHLQIVQLDFFQPGYSCGTKKF